MRPAPSPGALSRLRPVLVLVALILVAPLAAPSGAASAPRETLSCTPPSFGNWTVVTPCAVSGRVDTMFVVRLTFSAFDDGIVVVEAAGPGGARVLITCYIALHYPGLGAPPVGPDCLTPIRVLPPIAGQWTFTARPAIVDTFGALGTDVRLYVDLY